MRHFTLLVIAVSTLLACGCELMNPNSRFNVNRGEYHDEYDAAGREGRGSNGLEREPDNTGKWLYSPKAQAIDRNLGIQD